MHSHQPITKKFRYLWNKFQSSIGYSWYSNQIVNWVTNKQTKNEKERDLLVVMVDEHEEEDETDESWNERQKPEEKSFRRAYAIRLCVRRHLAARDAHAVVVLTVVSEKISKLSIKKSDVQLNLILKVFKLNYNDQFHYFFNRSRMDYKTRIESNILIIFLFILEYWY